MVSSGQKYCDQCRLVIAPFAPQIKDEDGEFHLLPCYKLKNLKKRMAERQARVVELRRHG